MPGTGGSDSDGNTLYGKPGLGGGRGEAGTDGASIAGGASQAGTYGNSSSTSSGGSTTQAGTKLAHVDPHLVTTMRDIYSISGDFEKIAASAQAGSGASGGGGAAVYGQIGPADVTISGGAGAAGGGSGGAGGTVMICARLIESDIQGGTEPEMHFDASGGDGGDGGDGGNRATHSY